MTPLTGLASGMMSVKEVRLLMSGAIIVTDWHIVCSAVEFLNGVFGGDKASLGLLVRSV